MYRDISQNKVVVIIYTTFYICYCTRLLSVTLILYVPAQDCRLRLWPWHNTYPHQIVNCNLSNIDRTAKVMNGIIHTRTQDCQLWPWEYTYPHKIVGCNLDIIHTLTRLSTATLRIYVPAQDFRLQHWHYTYTYKIFNCDLDIIRTRTRLFTVTLTLYVPGQDCRLGLWPWHYICILTRLSTATLKSWTGLLKSCMA